MVRYRNRFTFGYSLFWRTAGPHASSFQPRRNSTDHLSLPEIRDRATSPAQVTSTWRQSQHQREMPISPMSEDRRPFPLEPLPTLQMSPIRGKSQLPPPNGDRPPVAVHSQHARVLRMETDRGGGAGCSPLPAPRQVQ